MNGKKTAFGLLLVLNVLVVYSNHFRNDFQFDDLPAIPRNAAISDPGTILRAFVDPTLFSSAPEQRNYRPVTTASLALDYWVAGGLNVFFFHLSTFIWFSVQLVLMFLLFERLMNQADPHPSNFWTALAAAAAFGLHPASAETVNFIIQRADLYNALGCVASLALFIWYPSQRKFGWYLLPAVLAMLAKAPAVVFPLLLVAYVVLFELESVPARLKWKRAIVAVLPAALVTAAVGWLLVRMQPATWGAGKVSPAAYRLTQPFVALHYFTTFFLPTGLNVDHGWPYLAPLSIQALAGYFFVLGLLAVAALAARSRTGKPVAFGILWFFITLLPTSLLPLGDVTNDHRMFFAFVGLTLAVFWSLRLTLFRQTARLTAGRPWVHASVTVLAALLVLAGAATRGRNRVWLTWESLWSDSVSKNPRNPRALTNYGSMAYFQGDYQTALTYWRRASALDATCVTCQTNMVRASLKLHRNDLVERYLQRLVSLGPAEPQTYIAYGVWLTSSGRYDEASRQLDRAARLDPRSEDVKQARIGLIRTRTAATRSALFRALDSDKDNRLSTGELLAAPSALLSLDKNHDGKLSFDECGANREAMRLDPLLRILDTNHDGVLSSREISEAGRRLSALDRDENGELENTETVPDYVTDIARHLMALLDRDHSGRIEAHEWLGKPGEDFRSLLIDADGDGDGVVSLAELTSAIFYRADRDKDGVVTPKELEAAISAGLLGPIPRAASIPLKPTSPVR